VRPDASHLRPHHRLLVRHSVLADSGEIGVADAQFAEREPALAALARASVSGLAPTGPERRERLAIALRGEPGVEVKGGLSVAELGFTLRAALLLQPTTASVAKPCASTCSVLQLFRSA
jgi:hypothetical protein